MTSRVYIPVFPIWWGHLRSLSSFSSFTDLAEPKLSWRHLLPSGLSAVFKCHWSKGEKERGTTCDSSGLLRDGPSSARPSCPAAHPMGLPNLCPLSPSTGKAVKQVSRKDRRREQEAQGGLEQDLSPKQHQGETLAQPQHSGSHYSTWPSLPSCKLLPVLTSCSASPWPSSSPKGEFALFERFIQTSTEQPMPH